MCTMSHEPSHHKCKQNRPEQLWTEPRQRCHCSGLLPACPHCQLPAASAAGPAGQMPHPPAAHPHPHRLAPPRLRASLLQRPPAGCSSAASRLQRLAVLWLELFGPVWLATHWHACIWYSAFTEYTVRASEMPTMPCSDMCMAVPVFPGVLPSREKAASLTALLYLEGA